MNIEYTCVHIHIWIHVRRLLSTFSSTAVGREKQEGAKLARPRSTLDAIWCELANSKTICTRFPVTALAKVTRSVKSPFWRLWLRLCLFRGFRLEAKQTRHTHGDDILSQFEEALSYVYDRLLQRHATVHLLLTLSLLHMFSCVVFCSHYYCYGDYQVK